MKQKRTWLAWALAFALAFALTACGGNAGGAADSSSSDTATEESSAEQTSEQASTEASTELKGKPWVMSIITGNLPAEQPEAKDDFFTHYNYDFLAERQSSGATSAMEEHAQELKTACLNIIQDSSKSSDDLDKLRLFFEQASDTKTLKKIGLKEVQPYLDSIDGASSIEELNEVLTSDDFPFSPFVFSFLTLDDTRDVNIVNVTPNLALVDPVLVGGTYYQDTDDPQKAEEAKTAVNYQMMAGTALDFMTLGYTEDEQLQEAFDKVYELEKTYGKYADYGSKYAKAEFGAMSKDIAKNTFTMDEMCAICPNFPMQETLEKLGKESSPRYIANGDWLKTLNELWTTDNLDDLKLIAKLKVLGDTRPYRDHSVQDKLNVDGGGEAPAPETYGYNACNELDTFAIVLGNTYVDEVLGADAKTRITELSEQLIDTYKDLVNDTEWLGKESKQLVTEKLDHMTLNVLEPSGGYYDFSGLELTPTDQGGTCMSNYLKLRQYRLDQESKMVGKPAVATGPWYMLKPTTLNAFYDPASNSMNIFPAYVTSLVYANDMSDTDLLSGIGTTIGHEISHGFDYQGAQFDAYGTPNAVFSDEDLDAFLDKCDALAKYYSGIEVWTDTMADGDNVKTEAAADLCGMQVALAQAAKTEGIDYKQFFANYAHVWAQASPEAYLPSLLMDAHPLHNLRTNISSQMFDPIYDELGISEGDGMYLAPDERINIWGPKA